VGGGGGHDQGLLQFLELYGCRDSVSSLAALPIAVVGALDISPDGDDTMRSWHIYYQVGIVWDYHKLGECRPPEECIVRRLEVKYLKLQVFRMEIFLSPKGYGKSNLANGGRCCTSVYALKRSPTGAQCRS
jgi:hypothetical protein